MKTIVAGLTLLLLFLIPSLRYAGSGAAHETSGASCKRTSWDNRQRRPIPLASRLPLVRRRTSGAAAPMAVRAGGTTATTTASIITSWRVDRGAFCQPRRRVVGKKGPRRRRRAGPPTTPGWAPCATTTASASRISTTPRTFATTAIRARRPVVLTKKVYFRCVVEATPCRAPTGASEERYERRYEEDDAMMTSSRGRTGPSVRRACWLSLSRSSRASRSPRVG